MELTPAETEKSIDLHKVSRGSQFCAIQIQNLRENRNFERIQNDATVCINRGNICKLALRTFG